MSPLIISPSGIRGVVGKGLTPEVVTRLVCAFGKMRQGKILVGYDTRTSNQMFKYAAFSGLLSVGCEAVDLGICPTPSLQLMVKESGAQGGIVITGSHNPVEWNAIKFVRDDGLFLLPEEGEQLLQFFKKENIPRVRWDKIGEVSWDNSAIEHHLKKVLEVVDAEKIRSKKFKVVIDACNGAGSVISPLLLEKLGCEVVRLNCETNGVFPHPPEPIPDNLQDLCKLVRDSGADIGFAHDADADRLVLVSEKGEGISEEYTLLIVTKFVLSQSPGPVVTNICTSQAVDDVAKGYGCPVVRTKVGDVYVSRCMREHKAVIGGEGNGGIIFPALNYARDGIVALALILNYLALTENTISSIIDGMPRYYMLKRKIDASGVDVNFLKEELLKNFSPKQLDFLDGIKLWLKEGWIHIRPSGTEPVLRIIGEAKTPEEVEKMLQQTLNFIDKHRGKGNASYNCVRL